MNTDCFLCVWVYNISLRSLRFIVLGLVGLLLAGLDLLLDDGLALSLGGRLGNKHGVDVRQHTTLGDGDAAEELVELLVVADGQLNVARHNAGLLVVAGGIAGQLEDLSGKVLEDRGQVYGGAGSNASGVLALLQVSADTAHGELKTSLGRFGLRLLAVSLSAATLAALSTDLGSCCCFR